MKQFFIKYQLILNIFLLAILVLAYTIADRKNTDIGKDLALQMQNQLQFDEVLLNEVMLDLREVLLISGKSAFEQRSLDYQEKYKDRFAFFLYDNGKLDLWTDNHIPVPADESLLSTDMLQHFGSYQVLVKQAEFHHFTMVGLQIIKFEYPWQNDYLINHIAPYFKISAELNISNQDGLAVYNKNGKPFFYIKHTEPQLSNKLLLLPFVLFSLSFFFLAFILRTILNQLQKRNTFAALFIFIGIIFSWFIVHLALGIPEQFFQSKLFSPALYANIWIQSSLGNLFFISLCVFLVVIYYFSNFKHRVLSKWWIYVYLTFIYLFFFGIIYLIRSLVFDSQINLNLYQLASLNTYSYIALWIIFITQLSWLLIAFRWLGHFGKVKGADIHLWLFFIAAGLFPLLIPNNEFLNFWVLQLLISIFLIVIYYFQSKQQQSRRLGEVILYLIFFTFITSWYLNELSQEKEKQFRQTTALTLELENDPFLEAHFLSCINDISKDSNIQSLLMNMEIENTDDSLLLMISEKYFSEFTHLYNTNLIQCDENSLITVFPENIETPCYAYFQDRISNAQDVILPDLLYLIKGSFQFRNYIGMIPIQFDSVYSSIIFIEFVSKIKPKEMGLPIILEKAHLKRYDILKKYSYAIYDKGILMEWHGKYDYKQKLPDYSLVSYHDSFFEKDSYQHYIYSKNCDSVLIISLEIPGILQKLASFAFIFLFYSLLTFILYSLFTDSLHYSISSFQGRLQYSMIVLLLFSFILIGVTSLYYIDYLNRSKNEDILLEKAHSVLIELEHKISGISDFNPDDKAYVESLLIKFSEVFFTDITLYGRDGKLLASSRPEMFSAELLSDRMDANAYYQLSFLKNSFHIQDEKIGIQTYLSAYLPFRNQDNKSVAYLNLPYFAKQYELEEEVSGFIVAFLNIYLFLLFITIIITVIISRYLSKPIQLIRDKMSHLDLQHTNEKIEWNKDDEIGELIKEYNRMVDELNLSAQKLAASQRESAWREMAQQIAHEIKNPLTPMKLNVQYLQKAWDDGAEDYEVRMKRITKGLQEQIDALGDIAGQFSTFAAIDKVYPEKIDLKTIIDDVLTVFKASDHISFDIVCTQETFLVMVDKNQMIRVFNNLYKNAIQAIGDSDQGKIITHLSIRNQQVKIIISDNGCGIEASELENIFEPRFTTKTSGMGLGLSLVKKMLANSGASISVESEMGKGSRFIILIPLEDA